MHDGALPLASHTLALEALGAERGGPASTENAAERGPRGKGWTVHRDRYGCASEHRHATCAHTGARAHVCVVAALTRTTTLPCSPSRSGETSPASPPRVESTCATPLAHPTPPNCTVPLRCWLYRSRVLPLLRGISTEAISLPLRVIQPSWPAVSICYFYIILPPTSL